VGVGEVLEEQAQLAQAIGGSEKRIIHYEFLRKS
jgi:hypothetical protein